MSTSYFGSEVAYFFNASRMRARAELVHSGNADPETLRLARRHIFSATTRRRSADWEQYDRIAATDKRVAMVLRPEHIYGSALAKLREAVAK